MVLIKLTVMFNDTNKYTVQLQHTTKLGLLSKILPTVIGRTEQDVLFVIISGQMLGYAPYSYDKTLADCQTIGHECMVHLIFKDPGTKYPDFVLSSSERNLMWQRKVKTRQEPADIGAMGGIGGLNEFIQSLGQAMMEDVVVTIDPDEYGTYVTTNAEDVNDQACSICQMDMAGMETSHLACGHNFHSDCIFDWLTGNSIKCPTCNRDVRDMAES